MAEYNTAVTLQDLKDAMPTLRLKLEAKSKSLKASKPRNQRLIQKMKHFVDNMFGNAEGGLRLEQAPTREVTERNMRRINEYFDQIQRQLDAQRQEILRELPTLPEDQQEQVVTFWAGVAEFIGDVLVWLKKLFDFVMDKIRQGFQIAQGAVKGLFDWIRECLVNVF